MLTVLRTDKWVGSPKLLSVQHLLPPVDLFWKENQYILVMFILWKATSCLDWLSCRNGSAFLQISAVIHILFPQWYGISAVIHILFPQWYGEHFQIVMTDTSFASFYTNKTVETTTCSDYAVVSILMLMRHKELEHQYVYWQSLKIPKTEVTAVTTNQHLHYYLQKCYPLMNRKF